MRPNDVQIFPHILDLLTVASPSDVKPPSRARVDLDTEALARRKQPAPCRLGVGPGIEYALRRYTELARETNFGGSERFLQPAVGCPALGCRRQAARKHCCLGPKACPQAQSG